MTRIHPAWLAREQRRWLRPDAHRWWRPDYVRFDKPSGFERKYSPDQPRVPAGNPDGGQWTSGDGGSQGGTDVSSTRRRSSSLLINGRWVETTPAQAARYEAANARAKDAIARVRELDPNWQPAPSAYGIGIESEINRASNLAIEAEARIAELGRVGIGPGPFASESVPAFGSGRYVSAWERSEINRIGSITGCHTCGALSPGTRSGNFVFDHQPPLALNPFSRERRGYPHCVDCMRRQGGTVTGIKGGR